MISIVNYGLGNIGSVQNMLKRLGHQSVIAQSFDEVAQASKIILPGVGAFDNGMSSLRERGLIEVLNQKVLEDKVPVLGICLGMQLMADGSEEGQLDGLGWVKGRSVRFKFDESSKLKVPHMGWLEVALKKQSRLFPLEKMELEYYFVHSYHLDLEDPEDLLLEGHFGIPFTAAFEHSNIFGAQFHPEKSHRFGMDLLDNFARL